MQIAEALEFVRSHARGVLTTRRSDGSLQQSPVTVGVLADVSGGVLAVSSTQDRAKTRNLRRDGRASLLVFTDEFFGPWVQLDGTGNVLDQSDPATLDRLVELYRAVGGEHPDWDDYREAMVRDRRVVLCVRPERASGEL
jgi:PPOX class probable F420-dependent enzyme